MSVGDHCRKRRAGLSAIIGALMLAGCTGLPFDEPPPRLFVLDPTSTFPENLPEVSWQMTVDLPLASDSLSTSRIAVHSTDISLNYYEGVAWTDAAPKMVQSLLIENFEKSRRILGVARRSASIRADYNLITELRDFQAELRNGDAPEIRVAINAKMVRFPQREIIAATAKEAVVRARGGTIEEVVRAFDDAIGTVLEAIVEWTLATVPPEPPSRLIR